MNRAIFLDRDGVVNVDHGYVHRIDQFEFVPGIFELVSVAIRRGYLAIVVTNQAGIARGYYSELAFWKLTNWMLGQFHQRGAPISAVYYCPYHPVHGQGPYLADSEDRKPRPGMLLRAASDFSIDMSRSVMVGDKDIDVAAARAAAVGTAVLLSRTSQESARVSADFVVRDLREAAACVDGFE